MPTGSQKTNAGLDSAFLTSQLSLQHGASGDARTAPRGTRSPHDPLTLRQCLEHMAQFGNAYTLTPVTTREITWSAAELLAWLAQNEPASLEQPMYLRFPDPHQDGAIYRLTSRGGFMVLYRIGTRS